MLEQNQKKKQTVNQDPVESLDKSGTLIKASRSSGSSKGKTSHKNSSKTPSKIQVFPTGMAMGGGYETSFILFKNESKKTSFPVFCPEWICHLVASTETGEGEIYDLSSRLLTLLGYEVLECCFDKVEKEEQRAFLVLAKEDDQLIVELPAFEAFGLSHFGSEVVYSAYSDFISSTRNVESIQASKEILRQNSLQKSNQKYLM